MNVQYHPRVLCMSSLAAAARCHYADSSSFLRVGNCPVLFVLASCFFSRTISLRNARQTRMHFSFLVTERFSRVLLARLLARATRKKSTKLTKNPKKRAAMGGCIQPRCSASPPETGPLANVAERSGADRTIAARSNKSQSWSLRSNALG